MYILKSQLKINFEKQIFHFACSAREYFEVKFYFSKQKIYKEIFHTRALIACCLSSSLHVINYAGIAKELHLAETWKELLH